MSQPPEQQPAEIESQRSGKRMGRPRLFRREALDHQAGGGRDATLLQITPAWTDRAYWLLVAVCGFALVYVAIGRINEYAEGAAIIQSEGRTDVSARAAGIVESVDIRSGQRVIEGQILVRLYSASEAADLHRIDSEFELQLVNVLRDPNDGAARGALASLRAARELALSHLTERTIRAPHAGIVSDVRIRPGQQLEPGDFVLSVTDEAMSFRVLAMLPGRYRPLLRRGMAMRLELQGYAYAYQTVVIDEVGNEVVGPAEIRRYLRQASADIDIPQAPMVLVEARLPTGSFLVHGKPLDLYEGMHARAEVAVRAESILISLVPGLERILRD